MNNELEIVAKASTDIVDGTRFVTSINTDTPEGAVEIFNALSDAEDIRDHLGETLEIVHFAAEPAEFEDENGEVRAGVRTVLITKDGLALQSGSDQLVRSLNRLFGIFGTPDTWKEPVRIVVTDEISARKRHFFKVRAVK
jgi:hypothetical protein